MDSITAAFFSVMFQSPSDHLVIEVQPDSNNLVLVRSQSSSDFALNCIPCGYDRRCKLHPASIDTHRINCHERWVRISNRDAN